MNEPIWYCVDKNWNAFYCMNEEDAEYKATLYNAQYKRTAPHRAAQLVDASELEALRSVSTEMARKGMAIRMELEAANSRVAELESQLKVAREFMLND